MKDLLLIGGGGHCRSIIDSLNQNKEFLIKGIIDLEERIGEAVAGYPVIGHDGQLKKFYSKGYQHAVISLGSIGNAQVRERIYKEIKEIGFILPIIVDKTAIVSPDVKISEGTFIGKGCILNTGVEIGKCSIINTGAIIDHDSSIGDFVHIAPGSVLSGSVVIKDNVHLGTNCTVIQNITINENTLIGAGSVVVKSIDKDLKAYGNPCKEVID